MAKKAKFLDCEVKNANSYFPPGRLSIKIKSGQEFTKQVDLVRGHPQNALSFIDIADKLKDCTSFSWRPDDA